MTSFRFKDEGKYDRTMEIIVGIGFLVNAVIEIISLMHTTSQNLQNNKNLNTGEFLKHWHDCNRSRYHLVNFCRGLN